jgi:Kef-type K+ transport system membrane component KefB
LKPELAYVLLLFALFVVPKLLLRFRVPTAATEVALGAAAGMGLGWFQHDTTVTLLASLGIISLFLFAGLEVDVQALARHRAVLLQHLGIAALFLVAGAWVAARWLGFEPRSAALLSLAILTPSTGFILSSVGSMGFGPNEVVWIKSKTIATELLALLALFAVIQSSSLSRRPTPRTLRAGA